eukprot:755817-Hanusia_phi.AAC.2
MALFHESMALGPSTANTIGRVHKKASMLTTPYWLAGPIAFTQGCFMMSLPCTPLRAAHWLAIMAEMTDNQENESSFTDASATPPMIGRRAAYTGQAWTLPRRRASLAAEKTGSQALRICAKLTAAAPREITEPPWAPAAHRPIGAICFQLSAVILGEVRMPRIQRGMTQRMPTKS